MSKALKNRLLVVLAMALGLAVIPAYASTYGLTEKTVTKVITHTDEIITDNITVNLTVTLTGTYSLVDTDPYSVMTSISATKSGSLTPYITLTSVKSGNNAYLRIKDTSGTMLRTFVYTINTSGYIYRSNIIVH
jgi:hypothetical protein